MRPHSLAGIHQDACCRIRGELGTSHHHLSVPSSNEHLLLQAEKTVRRTLWLRKSLPLNLLMLLPGLFFAGTRSRIVLAILVAAYPLMLVVRAVLNRLLSAWIGSEETLIRAEYQRLVAQSKSDTPPFADDTS